MEKRLIVTIGRQFGSGGHEIGQALAKRFGMTFYDRELLEVAARESGLDPSLFADHDERPVNSLLYSLAVNPYTTGHMIRTGDSTPITQKLFLAQFSAIQNLAAKENCVFVGRCADYVLRDNPDCVNLFIHAPLDKRIQRIKERMELSTEQARDIIVKTDKKRAAYYNFYSDKKWGSLENYHLALDSSRLTTDQAVSLIACYLFPEG